MKKYLSFDPGIDTGNYEVAEGPGPDGNEPDGDKIKPSRTAWA